MVDPKRVKREETKTYQHRAEPGVTQAAANELVPLQFNGVGIHERGEMLSLTDMWRAAGGGDAKRPANWARKEGSNFIEHMESVLNVPHGHIITGARGRTGQTFGHWQVALAYAKYLSPEFHVACNVVIRDHMEARTNPVIATSMILAKLDALDERVARIDGMGRMTVHKVTGIQNEVALSTRLDETVNLLVERKFAELQMAIVPDLTAGEVIEMAGLTDMKGLRRLSRWVSDRLRIIHAEKGVAVRRAKLGRSRAYVFDERVCRDWLLDGGKEAILMRAQEMRGQGILRLVVPKQNGILKSQETPVAQQQGA